MRKLGLIGGMSWTATEVYYRAINVAVARARGERTSAPLAIESLNWKPLANARDNGDWKAIAATLTEAARRLETAGATALLIANNSLHRVAGSVADALNIPVLHIADAVGEALAADKVASAAIVGTRHVMTEKWYRDRLARHGVTLAEPIEERVAEFDRIIDEELMNGEARRDSERTIRNFLTHYDKEGADAVVVATTELRQIIDTKANVLPIYDSTELHAAVGAEWVLGEE